MDRAKLLTDIPMFETLSPTDLEALAKRLEERSFAADELIFRQGDEGASSFLVVEGSVAMRVGVGTARVLLAPGSRGQCCGEHSRVDGAPRSATATAVKPTWGESSPKYCPLD